MVFSSCWNQNLIIFCKLHICHMTWMSTAFHALRVLNHTWIFLYPYLSIIVTTYKQFHLWIAMLPVWSVHCIHISSIHISFKNPLNWPSQSNVPCCPILISCLCRSRRFLSSCLSLPKEKLITSASRVDCITVFRKIKMFYVTVMFDFFMFKLYITLFPFININKTQMITNS